MKGVLQCCVLACLLAAIQATDVSVDATGEVEEVKSTDADTVVTETVAETVDKDTADPEVKTDTNTFKDIMAKIKIPSREDILQYWETRTILQRYCIVGPQLIAITLCVIAYLTVAQDGQSKSSLGADAYLNGANRNPKTNGRNRAVMYPGEENKEWGQNDSDFLS